jgi:large subunit ribosomal protein L23
METKFLKLSRLLPYFHSPSITEKSIQSYGKGLYTFLVGKNLTKEEIRFLIEEIFNVKVKKVRTNILPTRTGSSRSFQTKGRKQKNIQGKYSTYKKAMVTLKEGNSIREFFN